MMRLLALVACLCLSGIAWAAAGAHPKLLLAKADLTAMAAADQRSAPLFVSALNDAQQQVDAAMAEAVDIPLPKDPGGGYSHERHKLNARLMYQAGQLYSIKADERYALWVRDLLLRYASIYPSLPLHPEHKHQAPGKLFWQILNDAWWLTYVIQAYDMVMPALSSTEQKQIETGLLRPYADFLSEGSARTFNKIHNHGTWAAAAVGMTGLVLADDRYLNRALKGLDQSGKSGFLRQLDLLFSPDGYYTEGPYYQRYALLPFVMFARALDRHRPDLNIFEYRDNILIKAVYAAIQLTDGHYFLPLNDAIKDKGLDTIEMVNAVAIVYAKTHDPQLLDIARIQNQVVLTGDGLQVARDLAAGKAVPFEFKSMVLRDGPQGKQGAVALLRSGDTSLVFKAASQGMGHGHFDRLGWQLYYQGEEVVSDYGAARYLNVEPKRGGIYLPENKSWAKQTIAHNTLVVDETSHFAGNVKKASKSSPVFERFVQADEWQLVSAKEANAYPGVTLSRSLLLLNLKDLQGPLVVDLVSASASQRHQYDLPLHFSGQLMNFNGKVKVNSQRLVPLGVANGYQHLWHKATVAPEKSEPLQASWLFDNHFYTLTSLSPSGQTILVTQLGANDPEFNLRNEQALITRAKKGGDVHFAQLIEKHGAYDGRAETVRQPRSRILNANYVFADDIHQIVLELKSGQTITLLIADQGGADATHAIELDSKSIQWLGPVKITVQ